MMDYLNKLKQIFTITAIVIFVISGFILAYYFLYDSAIFTLLYPSFILFTLLTLFALFGLFFYTSSYVKQLFTKLQSQQTTELLLVQSFIASLIQAKSIKQIAHITQVFLTKLFPSFSGVFLFFDKKTQQFETINTWGENISGLQCHNTQLQDKNTCNDCRDNKQKFCLQLTDQQELLATIVIFSAEKSITTIDKKTLTFLATHLSHALANIVYKQELSNQAISDPLTRLHNRRYMNHVLEQHINRAKRHQLSFALLMIDLDYFKSFNDKYGHAVGDFALQQLAHHLDKQSRLEDIACRYGGEEFILICPDLTLTDAFKLAEKLRLSVNMLNLTYDDKSLPQLSISIGVAVYPNNGDTIESLLVAADNALYKAKYQGRNQTVVAANLPNSRQLLF
jgi:diguanylate cyclase (GGDEF)-like protein